MKYYIEFELPDNDVVLERIEHEWVKWGVWGYSGYAYAKPVAYEKPDLSTMLFSERKELADKYEQWAKKNCVEDCALSVISYLCAFGYIPTLFNRERKTGHWIIDGEGMLHCSACAEIPVNRIRDTFKVVYDIHPLKMNYCPNCGVRMVGEQE